jgi:hypothetical protein
VLENIPVTFVFKYTLSCPFAIVTNQNSRIRFVTWGQVLTVIYNATATV